jgi:hypothetical protein
MHLPKLASREAAIIARLAADDQESLSPPAAQGILAIHFAEGDQRRMNALAAKAREGKLTPREEAEAEAYLRVGSLIGTLKSKARQALKGRNGTNRSRKPQ